MPFEEIERGVTTHGILSLDLETTSLNTRKAEILLIAMASGKGNGLKSTAVSPTPEAISFLLDQLMNPDIRVVGHNLLSYDMQVLHHTGIIDIRDVKAKLVDTLPLVWLLDENIDHGLKFSVKKYLKYDMVTYKQAFERSPALHRIREIDEEIKRLERQVIDRVGIEKRRERSQKKKAYEDLIKQKLAGRRSRADTEERRRLLRNMDRYLQHYFGEEALEDEKERIRQSQIGPLLVERSQREIEAENDKRDYAADDAKQTLRLYRHVRKIVRHRRLLDWADMEIKVQKVSSIMEINGMPIDADRLQSLKQEFAPLVQELEGRVFDIAKMEFNPRSPKQVKHVLYEVLGVRPIDEDMGTDEKTLTRITHPIAQALLDYRAIFKLYSTYVVAIEEAIKDEEDGRLHGRFRSTGTRTGRWSSNEPNLQNIPSRRKSGEYDDRIQNLGPKIRWMFRAPKGRKLICADLSQIELRIIAHLTEDPTLQKIYTEDAYWNNTRFYTGDVHDTTRRKVSEMVGFDIGRKLAKNLNFGLCYGMSAKKFARYAKLYVEGTKDYDVESAGLFRDAFMNLYSGIPEILDILSDQWRGSLNQVGKHVRKSKYKMFSGRYRHFRKEDNPFGGKILNSIVQGSAADILKVIVWALDEYLIQNTYFKGTKIIAQVHDEIEIEADESMAEEVGILTKYIMELPWFPMSVPVLASAKICDDWSENGSDDIPEVGIVPPKESGIKPCVAILTKDQAEWASKFVPKTKSFMQHAGSSALLIPYEAKSNG